MSQKTDRPLIYGTPELARILGMKDSSVRRLVAKMHETDGVGTKITDRAWVFTQEDVEKIMARPDLRGKWQQGGGRKRYLEQRRQKQKPEEISKDK